MLTISWASTGASGGERCNWKWRSIWSRVNRIYVYKIWLQRIAWIRLKPPDAIRLEHIVRIWFEAQSNAHLPYSANTSRNYEPNPIELDTREADPTVLRVAALELEDDYVKAGLELEESMSLGNGGLPFQSMGDNSRRSGYILSCEGKGGGYLHERYWGVSLRRRKNGVPLGRVSRKKRIMELAQTTKHNWRIYLIGVFDEDNEDDVDGGAWWSNG
ncbi:hypothetical protein BDV93DRAFT_509923 [Ceratobasidium sp. AG-I]|nr:hypothetical protein BDV93DRAFT_509923 [Ceratobasidium sp. AG-I]